MWLLRPLLPILAGLMSILVKLLILPLYKIIVLVRIRLARMVISARGVLFLLFTNRYIFHATLIVISVTTLASQLQPKQATAFDAGQRSLLYTLATKGQDELVEEQVQPGSTIGDAHYLGADTISAAQNIDFDYAITDEDVLADMTVPGSLAFQPGSEQLGDSSTDVTTPSSPSEETPTEPARSKTETHIVKSGETIASIANRYQVNVGTILWANNLTAKSTLRPGDELKVPAASGVLYTIKSGDTIGRIAARYGVEERDVLQANGLGAMHTLRIGNELVIPGVKPPTVATKPPATTRPLAVKNTPRTTRTTSNSSDDTASEPDVPIARLSNKATDLYQEIVKNGAQKPDEKTTTRATRLLWPTDLRIITQYYGWLHTGVDIDGDFNNRILAAEDGVVDKAGWNNGGYGLQIILDHDKGLRTRYAHASKIFVQPGEQVKRGQTIGMIGTTGRSTGTHLHFEVYLNGVRKNPLTYVR